jgi:Virulence-associated protein E
LFTPTTPYGATSEEWSAFAKLFGDAILPSVCDLTLLDGTPNAALKDFFKRPSWISKGGTPYLYAWKNHKATPAQVAVWSADDRIGIYANCRNIQAIDIDCSTPEASVRMAEYFTRNIGDLPMRVGRPGRCTLLVKVDSPEPLAKSAFKLQHDGGAVEFLASGSGTMLAGTHVHGMRYFWPDGLPTSVPIIPLKDFAELWDSISELEGDGTHLNTHGRNERATGLVLDSSDPFVQVLMQKAEIRVSDKEAVHITCPWISDHTDGIQPSMTGASYLLATSTQPASYKCQHSACKTKNITHLHSHFSYLEPDFDDVPLVLPRELTDERLNWRTDPAWARKLDKSGNSVIDTTEPANIVVAMKYPELINGYILRYDTFTTQATLWDSKLGGSGPGYVELKDVHLSKIRNALATNPEFKMKFKKNEIEEQTNVFLSDNGVDSAKNALENLTKWDGVERLKYYARDVLKAKDNSYTSDVGIYIFVAAAARIMYAPVSVDGVPIFFGDQKCGKTTVISGMALIPEHYADMTFNSNPAEMYRQMEGRSIVGLDELAGLSKSEATTVKNFITKPSDTWTPKYGNKTMTQARRCIFVGSTNHHRFLVDPTGERRLLPVEVAVTAPMMGRDIQAKNLEQYYAEALAILKPNPKIVHEIYNRIDENPIAKEAKWAATKVSGAHSRILKVLASRNHSLDIVDVHEIYQHITGQASIKEYLLIEIGQSLKTIGYECINEDLHIYKYKYESLE